MFNACDSIDCHVRFLEENNARKNRITKRINVIRKWIPKEIINT